MRYIAAYLLNVLGGNVNPTSDDVRNVIASVGIDVDEDQLKLVMEKLAGKNIEEIQSAGMALLTTSVFGTNAPEEAPIHDDAVKPEVKEIPDKNEDSEDDDGDEGMFSLFGED